MFAMFVKLGVCPVMGDSQESPAPFNCPAAMEHSQPFPAELSVCHLIGHSAMVYLYPFPTEFSACPGIVHSHAKVPGLIDCPLTGNHKHVPNVIYNT